MVCVFPTAEGNHTAAAAVPATVDICPDPPGSRRSSQVPEIPPPPSVPDCGPSVPFLLFTVRRASRLRISAPEKAFRVFMISRLTGFCRQNSRRLLAFVVAASLLVSVVPIPVGRSAPQDKDSSRPFPCQNRPCGCRSADQCWKQCCCFTNAQKVAWARSRGVHPPAFVLAAAQSETRSATTKTACAHCSAHRKPKGTSERSPLKAAPSPARADVTNSVIGVLAQECHGHGWGWHAVPWDCVPRSFDPLQRPDLVVGPVTQPGRILYRGLTLEPPVPPPRPPFVRHFIPA